MVRRDSHRTSLQRKLLYGFLFLALVVTGFALFISALTSRLHTDLLAASALRDRSTHLQELKFSNRHAVGRAKAIVLEGTDPVLARRQYDVALQEIEHHLGALRAMAVDADDLSDYRLLDLESEQLRGTEERAIQAKEAKELALAANLVGHSFEPARAIFDESLDRQLKQANIAISHLLLTIRTTSLQVQVATFVALGFVLLAITLIYLMFKLAIIRPLWRLKETASKFAEGDLTARSHVHSADELGELAQAFNEMGERLEAYTQQVQVGARGLEEEVSRRTEELQEKVNELERFNKLTVGRELKMKELKAEVAKLRGKKAAGATE